MSGHTPTPWEVYDGGQYIRTVAAGRCIAKLDWNIRDDVDEANAAFIVLACNSHGELVEALERLSEIAQHYAAEDGLCLDGTSAMQEARAILAKVKAKGEAL